MSVRVTVFFDYQNIYRSARKVFGSPAADADYTFGQIHPVALAERIVAKRPPAWDSELVAVRVYRGLPDASKDPKGYGACRAQVAQWQARGAIVTTRPLRYPWGWPDEPAEEKGIDVELALDFATLALEGKYDVGVLMSLDTDLKPALEYVARRDGLRAEVAAWSVEGQRNRRLSVDTGTVWCHWLDVDDFHICQDRTDYVRRH